MRKILFRGKRVDSGTWACGYYAKDINYHVDRSEHVDCIIDTTEGAPYEGTWFEVTPETVGQFTGLHDKNGKEIYEGDIVKVEDYVAVIEWDVETCRFVINVCFENLIYDFDNFYGKELEVIGNIYENPELLEVM